MFDAIGVGLMAFIIGVVIGYNLGMTENKGRKH
jgi:hypothetical protein